MEQLIQYIFVGIAILCYTIMAIAGFIEYR